MKCHCGKPLHYSDPEIQDQVQGLVDQHGEFVTVSLPNGKSYRVSRHYIALHGIKAIELPELGFKEVA